MITSRLDAYILKKGDFCANDNDNDDDDDMTDNFTPCTFARGKYLVGSCELGWTLFYDQEQYTCLNETNGSAFA